jgi:nitroimidazol reductase NimA-like FMN-containing flavoprotein (pyridoxamine 5'-phosphate oxidase superfamily)
VRRKEKEIVEKAELEAVIKEALVCRIAMVQGTSPYVVPLCFGYEDNTLYFHSAKEGKKIEILRENNSVCFEMDTGTELIQKGDDACHWGMKFKSIIGFGKASILEDNASKRRALDTIMRQYAEGSFEYKEAALDKTEVIKVDIEQMTGKQSG